MADTSTKSIPVSSGAEAFLAQMKELGSVRYMFANTGTDHGPLIAVHSAKKSRERNRVERGAISRVVSLSGLASETIETLIARK